MNLQEKLEKRLVGGKFRLLNEKLYCKKKLSESEIKAYHKYYESQIAKWPVDPRKTLFEMISEDSSGKRVADIGCGTGNLSKSLSNAALYDKYPSNGKIFKADLDAIPASIKSFEAAVHCLSLMVTYIGKAVAETNRILQKGGKWYILEVRSRIPKVKRFISGIEKLGFKLEKMDTSNKYFLTFVFIKTSDCNLEARIPDICLKKCTYKK